MRTSDPYDQVIVALVKAAPDFKPVRKTATAKTPSYSYTYAPFDEVTAATWPALHKHGLVIVQTTDFEDGALTLITRLIHTSGQWIESRWPMPAYDKPQAAGAVLSYFRRYAVASLLRLSPEEDTDAQHTESAKPVPLPARKVEPKPEPAPKVPAAAELSPRQEIPPDVTRVEGHVIDLGKTTGTRSNKPYTRYVARLDASTDRSVTFDTRLGGYLEDSPRGGAHDGGEKPRGAL